MIAVDEFLRPLRDAGYDFFTGVPCSFLTPVINRVISSPEYDYVSAVSEGEAIAIADSDHCMRVGESDRAPREERRIPGTILAQTARNQKTLQCKP